MKFPFAVFMSCSLSASCNKQSFVIGLEMYNTIKNSSIIAYRCFRMKYDKYWPVGTRQMLFS